MLAKAQESDIPAIATARAVEPVRLVRFWQDHFSKKVQNIFQLAKNQMHG